MLWDKFLQLLHIPLGLGQSGLGEIHWVTRHGDAHIVALWILTEDSKDRKVGGKKTNKQNELTCTKKVLEAKYSMAFIIQNPFHIHFMSNGVWVSINSICVFANMSYVITHIMENHPYKWKEHRLDLLEKTGFRMSLSLTNTSDSCAAGKSLYFLCTYMLYINIITSTITQLLLLLLSGAYMVHLCNLRLVSTVCKCNKMCFSATQYLELVDTISCCMRGQRLKTKLGAKYSLLAWSLHPVWLLSRQICERIVDAASHPTLSQHCHRF